MGLRAVANPAAGGQPGSFTSLTATSLTVNGLTTMTATSADPALSVTQNGSGYSAFFTGSRVYAVLGLNVNSDIAAWAENGNVKISFNGAGSVVVAPDSGQSLIVNSMPTSSAGLAAGSLWNDAGTVKIV